MFKKSLFITLLLLCTGFLTVTAQDQITPPDPQNPEGENLQVPENWVVRVDRGRDATISADKQDADIWFVNMVPGWHITSGPAAIYYHPASNAEGTYRAESVIHLFEPSRNREAFGIFVGGNNLENENQSYLYFLLRNTGEFLVKRRTGDDTEVVKNWSSAPSMVRWTPDAGESVKNTLAVVVGESEVSFLVNGEQVHTAPRGQLDTDGMVGLRVNHGLNLHISDLSVMAQ